jgi:hypothetical protein
MFRPDIRRRAQERQHSSTIVYIPRTTTTTRAGLFFLFLRNNITFYFKNGAMFLFRIATKEAVDSSILFFPPSEEKQPHFPGAFSLSLFSLYSVVCVLLSLPRRAIATFVSVPPSV